jgi:hypothetical protein
MKNSPNRFPVFRFRFPVFCFSFFLFRNAQDFPRKSLMPGAPQPVMPAKAGIQVEWRGQAWIPAFAGMTEKRNLSAQRSSTTVV